MRIANNELEDWCCSKVLTSVLVIELYKYTTDTYTQIHRSVQMKRDRLSIEIATQRRSFAARFGLSSERWSSMVGVMNELKYGTDFQTLYILILNDMRLKLN